MRGMTRERRARDVVLVGGAVITLIVGLGRGIPAWRAWTADSKEAARTLGMDVRRTAHDLDDLARTRDSAQARRYELGSALPSLLHGVSATAASTDLTQAIGDAAEDAEVRIGSIDVRVDSSGHAAYVHVIARIDVTGDIAGVTRLLANIESPSRRMTVRDLSLSRSMSVTPAEQREVLQATAVVDGLARRGSGAKPPEVRGLR